MLLRTATLALALALAACSSKSSPAVVDNHASTAPAEPEAVLAAFADALRRDDGAALATLIDPEHGLTLWYTPGAGYAVFETIAAGDTRPPSKHVHPAVEDDPQVWSSYPWADVAQDITAGLAVLDVDPTDPTAPVYGDCSDEEGTKPVRAYLAHGQADRDLREMDLAGDGDVADADVLTGLAVFNKWGLRAYLRSTPTGWRLVHLASQEVCSI